MLRGERLSLNFLWDFVLKFVYELKIFSFICHFRFVTCSYLLTKERKKKKRFKLHISEITKKA